MTDFRISSVDIKSDVTNTHAKSFYFCVVLGSAHYEMVELIWASNNSEKKLQAHIKGYELIARKIKQL